jgi:hypothetical protein
VEGYYGAYECHEVPEHHLDLLRAAAAYVGPELRALGREVDTRCDEDFGEADPKDARAAFAQLLDELGDDEDEEDE